MAAQWASSIMANITIQHANTTSPISEADWRGTGAHSFGGLTALSAMVVNSAGQMQSRTMANDTLLGQVGGNMSAITIGPNGSIVGGVLDFATGGSDGVNAGQFDFELFDDIPNANGKVWMNGGPGHTCRIYKIDSNGNDIGSFLLSILPGSTVTVTQGPANLTTQLITLVTDISTYVAFETTDTASVGTLTIGSPVKVTFIQKGTDGTNGTAGPNDVSTNTTTPLTGILAGNGSNVVAGRTLTGTTNQVNVSDGTGASGDPVFSTPQDIHSGASPTFAGLTLTGFGGVVIAAAGVLGAVEVGTVAFTPTTGGNWSGPPATIQAALDELAARVKALEP